LQTKQAALSRLFCTPGKLFKVHAYDGSTSMSFIPRVANIVFEEGNWTQFTKYSISMETDSISLGATSLICGTEDGQDDVQESWNIEQADEKGRTFKMSHTVSAQANDIYDSAGSGSISFYGWEKAKERVIDYLGFDSTVRDESETGVTSGFAHYNRAIQEVTDIGEGKYSITETWLLYDGGSYLEEYTVSTRINTREGTKTVVINGTVTGLSTSDDGLFGNRWTNAQTGWTTVQATLFSRAQAQSGITALNSTPDNYEVGKNPLQGVITYNYEYSNRPCTTITGAQEETITVVDQLFNHVFAIHRCIARASGPIIQDIGTITENKRTLTIEAKMSGATGCPPVYQSEPSVTGIIAEYQPVPTGSGQGPYIERNEKSWQKTTGRYTRNITWVWTD
jgi:hypothetical protein